jgi:hypothetical protein
MQAGLLTPVAPSAEPDLMITMLDGDLGAVTGPDGTATAPRAEVLCWCGCIVCFSPAPQTVGEEGGDLG